MQPMSPQDASFLHIEDDSVTHMHIGTVGLFEGPPPTQEEARAAIESKLPLVPRYRQRVHFVPLDIGRPVWVDDPHFVLDYHLRRTALPSPGGVEQLHQLIGRVMSQRLDRARPLWEVWLAEGLDNGGWALLSKTHHCMVDGVSATDLLSVLLDSDRDPERTPAVPWQPDPEPNAAELVAQAVTSRMISPYEGVRSMRAAVTRPRRMAGQLAQMSKGMQTFQRLLRGKTVTSLNGPIGPHRRWTWARGRLSDIKTIRQGCGGTVNDVVLAVITRGFRDLLLGRGEDVADRVVRTMVPVSVRAEHERGTYNNKVSAMFAELPVGVDDPVERLSAIREQMEGLKQSGQAVAAERLTALSGFASPMLLALGGRVAGRAPQRNVQTVTTNVPGPQHPLFFSGRRMLEAFPFVPLGGSIRVGIAIFSYDGALNYGITGEYEHAADIEVLGRGIEEGIQELLGAAGTKPAKPRRRTKATAGGT
jgi:diacylglycerol O-acyltransferase / wax synthase